MSVDLADFGHDYRSVNLKCPDTYLLVRNWNLFNSRVPASMLLGSRRCSAWLLRVLVWSSVLSTRPSRSGMDGCAPVWKLMDNTSDICSEPQNSLIDWFLLFYNFAKTSCLACSQIVACFTRYSCNM